MLDGSSIDVDDYDFRTVSSSRRYDHENGLLGNETDERVEYTTYHTESDSETGAITGLNTLRLVTDKESKLVIAHKPSGDVILSTSLDEHLNTSRLQQYPDLSLQKYLDYVDKHGIILLFKGIGSNRNYIGVDMQTSG